jgi:hypothetical protein
LIQGRILLGVLNELNKGAPTYNLERIDVKDYRGYERIFERTGKYSGGVKGLDY